MMSHKWKATNKGTSARERHPPPRAPRFLFRSRFGRSENELHQRHLLNQSHENQKNSRRGLPVFSRCWHQALVVQRLDNTIRQINHYPVVDIF